MELFELMQKTGFPDKSQIAGLITTNKEHLGHNPSDDRQLWVDGGFLHGYLHLFKLQYDEVLHLLDLTQRDAVKQKKINGELLKEVRRLNDHLDQLQRQQQQLSFGFDRLSKGIESVIKQL